MQVEDPNFKHAVDTFIVSDIHLADAEPAHPRNPLWKKFKRPEFFIDNDFKAFLDHIQTLSQHKIELILNGDIFDFDSVMAMPEPNQFNLTWLERRRGLGSEKNKSRFKIKTILNDHPVWVNALRSFIKAGHKVIFVIGNHDLELHWPVVQKDIIEHLALGPEHSKSVRFVEWFYISNSDTLVEHGNQYDAYCLCTNPINPLIRHKKRLILRLPFGNLAGKYMLNGMGLMNPHSEGSFIKSSVSDYLVFFYKYVLRTQPLLFLTWLWGALATLIVSVTEGLRPAINNPLTITQRVDSIAKKANSNANVVYSLKELHVHPASHNPVQILRELWLDRAILFVALLAISFEIFLFFNLFAKFSIWVLIIPFLVLLAPFIFYASSVESDIKKIHEDTLRKIPTAARIAGVKRAVYGHTHVARHCTLSGVEYLNTGTWSPAFHDVECTQPYGKKCFVWIRPSETPEKRTASLYEWKDSKTILIEKEPKEVLVKIKSRSW